MQKNLAIFFFAILFLGLFYWMVAPKYLLVLTNEYPSYMGETLLDRRGWFVLHFIAGTIVYITGLMQFSPFIRNKYTSIHRVFGKVYIISSLLAIATLYIMLPDGLCAACRKSQYVVTSLWLIFVFAGYYFIKKRKFIQHQRMMIRSFICAAYFVTIRLVDRFAMGSFRSIFKNEDDALLASDISVWLVPLLLFQFYWWYVDRRTKIV
jgi:uncharacterized membrane protein